MTHKLKVFLLCSACFVGAHSAHAAGYQLNEYSTTNLGRSFAGAGVVGDDYSALAYNPAGMTLVKKSGVQGGWTVAEVSSQVEGKGAKQGKDADMDFGVSLPSLFAQHQVNDDWYVGLGVYAPYGLATKYKKDSYVADKARDSILEVIDTNLSVAYKVNSKLSLGAGFIVRYIYGNMTNNISADRGGGYSDFDLDGWTATGTVGFMYEFDDNNRIGLSYKPKSVQRVKGTHTISHNLDYGGALNGVYHDGKASPDLPPTWLLSGYTKPFEKVAFTGSLRYTQWSDSFEEFDMTSTINNTPIIYDWKDSITLSVGSEYYVNDNWTLRVGTAWDQAPTSDNKDRTHRIPDSDRIWVSAGTSYRYENMQFDLGYAHLFMKRSFIRNSINNDYDSEYNAYSNMFGLGFQYDF